MKKILITALTIAFLAWGSSAMALSFTDTTIFTRTGTSPSEDYDSHGWGDVNRLNAIGDHVSWTHHFGFDPPANEVFSGKLTLFLRDDGGRFDSFEIGFGWAEDGSWDLGEVNTGAYAYDIAGSFLMDGEFSLTLGSLWGDFFIDRSELEITYAAAPVPEPATILLMGTGLLGLVAYSRKRFSKKS